MLGQNSVEGKISGYLDRFASLLILLAILLPFLATISYISVTVNRVASFIQFLFVLVYTLPTIHFYKELYSVSITARVVAVLLVITSIGWLVNYIPVYGIYQSWFYAVQVLFVGAAVVWFERCGISSFKWLFFSKIIIFGITLALFVIYFLSLGEGGNPAAIKGNPPVFRHLRHFNYELAFLSMLAVGMFFVWRVRSVHYSFWGGLFLVLGFVSVWSGGRGQLLALCFFLLCLAVFSRKILFDRSVLISVLCFVVGGLLVFCTDWTYLVDSPLKRTVEFSSVNSVSSGRIAIWTEAIQHLERSVFFGFGPDAFLRLPMKSGPVQPHSFLFQWLLEFGIVGSLALFIALYKIVRHCLRVLRGDDSLAVITAASFLSGLVFALVDGILYHALPSIMMGLLLAFLYSSRCNPRRDKTVNGG
nr:O-antigen ligase family protein [Litorivivens lipolytica]